MVTDLVLQLKDCTYISKTETIKGKIPSGYDTVKAYVIEAETEETHRNRYQLGNITIRYIT